jgi:transcriptional regulator with XRE-family HTH domain
MSKYLPIGKRLLEERERMGLNQADFASIGGSTRKTQYNYEVGERVPDGAFLAAIAAAGADINYILTGNRTPSVAPLPDTLNADEAQLLRHYRQLASAADQAAVRRMLALTDQTGAPQPAPDGALAPPPQKSHA